MSAAPIFIHSLFRSGSTYIFKTFRRSNSGYWCYQEPLHEVVLTANDDPKKLLDDHGDELVQQLRHPTLDENYFYELVAAWPEWKDLLSDKAIYDSYFAPTGQDLGISFLQALVRAAKGRPVFQECRTAGRIAAIKSRLGGFHIYLWRNPWDQWWSYKVTPYFDAVNRLIINAPNAPASIRLMRDALRIESSEHENIADGMMHYWSAASTAEESYLIFYLLWCHGLREGLKHADLMLSIDRLSDSTDYQSEIKARLRCAGIDGLDFSDSRVPQAGYLDRDRAFFSPLEDQAHKWLRQSGWAKDDIDQIHALRQQYQPALWNAPLENPDPANSAEHASRAREVARRLETTFGARARLAAQSISDVEATAQQLRIRATEADARAAMAETRADEAETRAAEAETRAAEAETRANEAETRADEAATRAAVAETHADDAGLRALEAEASSRQAQTQLRAVYASTSWRITSPLRRLRKIVEK